MDTKRAALLALGLLVGCSGNPLGDVDDGGGGGGGDTTNGVPNAVAVNLKALEYNPAGEGTLRVTLDGIDASPVQAEFVRTPAMDINGYQAFVYQETGITRSHLAFVKQNARGNLRAGVASDGGQFNYHFGGGAFARIDTYTQPDTGLFSYNGSYVGVFVSGSTTTPALPASMQPGLPYRVSGDILINASFADARLDGGVTGRVVLDDAGTAVLALDDITLRNTEIEDDGRFLGDVEVAGDPGNVIGKYAGLFGGTNATDIAGALVINPIEGEDGIWEYGTWNLPRCGTTGEGPLCALQ